MRNLLGLALLLGITGSVAHGQVFLKPSGDRFAHLTPKAVDAQVTIERQIASTHLTLTYANNGWSRIEVEFVYVVPKNAVVTGFAYWYGAERVVARVVPREQAAEIYHQIVARKSDPALIELIGKRTFRARIFPIVSNQDLKVEIDLVQVLPGDGNSSTFTLPLAMPKGIKLSRLHASVQVKPEPSIRAVQNNIGIPVSQTESGWEVNLAGTEVRPIKDLRVALLYDTQPVRMSFFAARSGGVGGFFSLVITAGKTINHPNLVFTGMPNRDLNQPEMKKWIAGQTVLFTGRYDHPGPVHFQLMDSKTLVWKQDDAFSNEVRPNHMAVKLWASDQITRLGNNVKAVTALSLRHTIPSRFTSWLAIPSEEREQHLQEIAMAGLNVMVAHHAKLVARGDGESTEAKKLLDHIHTKSRSTPLLRVAWDRGHNWMIDAQYDAVALPIVREWVGNVHKHGQHSKSAIDSYKRLERLKPYLRERLGQIVSGEQISLIFDIANQLGREIGSDHVNLARQKSLKQMFSDLPFRDPGSTELFQEEVNRTVLEALAVRYVLAAEKGNLTKQLTTIRKIWKLKLAKHGDVVAQIYLAANNRAEEINEEENKQFVPWKELSPPSIRLIRLARIGQFSAAEKSKNDQLSRATNEINLRLDKLQKLKSSDPDAPAIRHEIQKILGLPGVADTGLYLAIPDSFELIRKIQSSLQTPQELGTAKEKLNQWGYPFGFTGRDILRSHFASEMKSYANEILNPGAIPVEYVSETRKRFQDLLPLLELTFDQAIRRYRTDTKSFLTRDLIIDRFRAGAKPADIRPLIEQFRLEPINDWGSEKPAFTDFRVERLYVDTLLERLQHAQPSAEVEAQRINLELQQKMLVAKMGDPLLSVTLPEKIIAAIAVMPWGEQRTLHFEPSKGVWEGRFDIPTSAKEGLQSARIIGCSADGTVALSSFEFRVDNQKPQIKVAVDNGQIIVTANKRLVRVKAIGPWPEPVLLVNSEGNIWRLNLSIPDTGIDIVAIDQAHNVTRVSVGPNGVVTEPLRDPSQNPTESLVWSRVINGANIQTISALDHSILAGTLDAGFVGPPEWKVGLTDQPGRSVIRCAAGTFARQANGYLLTWNGIAWTPLLPPSGRECGEIATDGTQLFLAYYDGYGVFDGYNWSEKFDVSELAGWSPSALLVTESDMWIGLQGRGIANINRATHKVSIYTETSGLTDDWVTSLQMVGDTLYAGTFANGVSVLRQGSWHCIRGTQGACITGMNSDGRSLFVASRSGLWRVSGDIATLINLPTDNSQAQAIFVQDGIVWLGTRNGLYRAPCPNLSPPELSFASPW